MGAITVNPYDELDYTLVNMTGAVNLIPNNYGRVREMQLFIRKGENTQRVVILDMVDGHITLLPSVPVNGPATQAKRGTARPIPFIIPHIPYNDRIVPSDIQGQREPGGLNPKTLENVMMNRLTSMRNSHAITEEFMSMGALKGVIIDGNGNVLVNLFTAFGKTQKVVDFKLGTEATDVNSKCKEVVRHIEDHLMGDVSDGVHCLCDETYFDKFVSHPNVEKYFAGHVAALQLAGVNVDPRKGFNFGGITFEEYRGKAPKADGSGTVPFIGEGDAHFFPTGTLNTFETFDAPADFMETVNTPGVPVYAKQVASDDGKEVKILTESNPLPICKRPAVLVKGSL